MNESALRGAARAIWDMEQPGWRESGWTVCDNGVLCKTSLSPEAMKHIVEAIKPVVKQLKLFKSLMPGGSFFTLNYKYPMPGGMPREWFVENKNVCYGSRATVATISCKTYVVEETEIDCRFAIDERWEHQSFDESEFILAGAVATREELE